VSVRIRESELVTARLRLLCKPLVGIAGALDTRGLLPIEVEQEPRRRRAISMVCPTGEVRGQNRDAVGVERKRRCPQLDRVRQVAKGQVGGHGDLREQLELASAEADQVLRVAPICTVEVVGAPNRFARLLAERDSDRVLMRADRSPRRATHALHRLFDHLGVRTGGAIVGLDLEPLLPRTRRHRQHSKRSEMHKRVGPVRVQAWQRLSPELDEERAELGIRGGVAEEVVHPPSGESSDGRRVVKVLSLELHDQLLRLRKSLVEPAADKIVPNQRRKRDRLQTAG
jgi:hypothetical protein